MVCSTSFQPSFQVLVAITYLLLAGVGENDKSSHGHYHFAELLSIGNSDLKVTYCRKSKSWHSGYTVVPGTCDQGKQSYKHINHQGKRMENFIY